MKIHFEKGLQIENAQLIVTGLMLGREFSEAMDGTKDFLSLDCPILTKAGRNFFPFLLEKSL